MFAWGDPSHNMQVSEGAFIKRVSKSARGLSIAAASVSVQDQGGKWTNSREGLAVRC